MKNYRLLGGLTLILSCLFLFSWDNITSIDQLIKTINDNNEIKRNDAIYVHTDKPYYIAGENLWFKVYLRKKYTLLPTKWSKGVNVELIDPNGEIIDKRKIYAVDEYSNGDFKLSTKLEEGRYRLRAYTNWMRNFGDSTFFSQEINVYQINPDSLRQDQPILSGENNTDTNDQVSNRRQKYDLQFFPESGQFISGVSTKFGVKLVNQSGFGEEFTAKVFNQNGNHISDVKGNHLGMGSTFINGVVGDTYYAILDRDTVYSKPEKYALPQLKEKGTTLFVINNKKLYIKIISTDDALKNGGHLIASSNNKVIYSWNCPPNAKLIPIKMPLDKVSNGIIKLTLLNKELNPIVERVVFNYTPQNIDISLDKDTYKKRERVELNINLKDTEGNPLTGDASVAIVDKKLVDLNQKKNNIITELILSDELKGHIENPTWYFEDFSTKKKFALDELMLTQGYRKIDWIKEATDSLDINFIPEPGISIRGKTSNFWNEDKLLKSEISMTSFDNNLIHESTLTDDKGSFTFTGMVFFDTTNFFFQAKKYNDRRKKVTNNNSVKISLFELEPPMISPLADEKINTPNANSLADFEKEILKIEKIDRAFNTKTIILDEIEITEAAEEPEQFQHSSKVHSNYRARFVPDSLGYAQGMTVWQFLQQEFRTAQILRRSGNINGTVSVDEEGNDIVSDPDELPVILDGFQVDMTILQSMQMSQVGFIDVLDMSEGSMYLPNSTNGVIAIYTQQGGGGSYIVKGIDNIKSPGFYTSREFYQPKYDVAKDEHAKPDHRITLLWEPNVTFDASGNAKLSFYTDDKNTEYQLEVEGISSNGTAFSKKLTFENN